MKKKRVVVFGIFDGVHEGHRDLFGQAREHGKELIVIVGRDSASLRWKGKKPRYSEQERVYAVKKEEGVSDAVLGDEAQSTYRILEALNPYVVCLGYDQEDLEADLKKWMEETGKTMPIFRLKKYG